MLWREIAEYMPASVGDALFGETRRLTEIRMRVNQPVQLVYYGQEDAFVGDRIGIDQLRDIALMMMEHSYHTYEHELSKGFFTMKNGCRVGVGGSFVVADDGEYRLKAISSLCVRIAGESIGCAETLVGEMLTGGLRNTLVLSAPGMGKTTLLRDAARILSTKGYRVGIADERHEIAACIDGIPNFDLGPRCDIIDGCPKNRAVEILIRSLNPQIIFTDEIGNAADACVIREAARRGVIMIASAHAATVEEFGQSRLGGLMQERLFPLVVLLAGSPGRIAQLHRKGAI